MRRLTQTVTGLNGNCWQTCVACLLGVAPESLPSQEEHDRKGIDPDGRIRWMAPGYNNPLQAYLRKHHGLSYVEFHMPSEVFTYLRVAPPGGHLISGVTERSASLGGLRHMVVGRYGKVVWDPHPSRAGLIGDHKWSFLMPTPKEWQRGVESPCVCPRCR
jgi:hypothetical protein